MTPAQLRELADRFTASRPAPHGSQPLSLYVLSETAHAMAQFLREMADREEHGGEPQHEHIFVSTMYDVTAVCTCGAIKARY